MKHNIFRVFGPALLATSLFAVSCGNVFQEPKEKAIAANGGIARISIGGRTAGGRTLQPDHLALYYALEFTKGEETVPSLISDGTGADVELGSGTWDLDVKGYLTREDFEDDPEYPVITGGAAGIEIRSGAVTPVTVTLAAAQTEDGIGWISFDLSFPDTVDSAVLDIKPLLGAPTTLYQPVNLLDTAYATDNGDGTLRSAGQVDENFGAGFYRLNYTLFIGGGTFPRKLVRTMVVHIYDGLVSPLVAEYILEDFTEFNTFTSIADLKAYLASQPDNTRDNPHVVALEGLEFKDSLLPSENPFFHNSDKLGALYDAFQGKYVALDLSACAGNIPDTTSANSGARGTNRNRIISLVLPDSMTSIGAYAFSGCNNLDSVDLPAELITVGDNAFEGCSALASVDFDGSPSLQSLGISSFSGIAITGLVLPASVDSLGAKVFYECINLVSADISACDITVLPVEAFRHCSQLNQISLPAGLVEIGNQTFTRTALGPTLDLSSFTELTTIRSYAFYECKAIRTAVFPASLTTLDMTEIFYGDTALTSVDFSACTNLTNLGSGVFRGCTSLESVILPPNLEITGTYTFQACTALESLDLPASLTSIGNEAFRHSGLSGTLDLSSCASLATIGSSAFQDCAALTSFVLPASLTSIGQSAFNGTGLGGTLDLSAYTTIFANINTGVFANCTSLTSVILPASLASIGQSAFASSGLSGTLDLSAFSSLVSIGIRAFENCAALESVILPTSLTTIGAYAFTGSGLTVLDLSAATGLATINNYIFQNCAALESITLPPNITSIGTFAFQNCTALTSIVLPASLTTLSREAFSGCSSLAWVKWPVSGANATIANVFPNCVNLAKVELPDKLSTSSNAIAANAFNGCTVLQVLIIRTEASSSSSVPRLADASTCIPQNEGLKIYVPADSETYFEAATNWSNYSSFINPDTAITGDDDPSAWQ